MSSSWISWCPIHHGKELFVADHLKKTWVLFLPSRIFSLSQSVSIMPCSNFRHMPAYLHETNSRVYPRSNPPLKIFPNSWYCNWMLEQVIWLWLFDLAYSDENQIGLREMKFLLVAKGSKPKPDGPLSPIVLNAHRSRYWNHNCSIVRWTFCVLKAYKGMHLRPKSLKAPPHNLQSFAITVCSRKS